MVSRFELLAGEHIDMFERDRASTIVARRQHHMVGGLGKHDARLKLLAVGNQKHAIPHLRHTVKGRVDETISRRVAKVGQCFCDFAHDVMPAIVENVWHVLDEQRERLRGLHVMEVSEVKVASWIDLKCARVLSDFAELCATNTGVGLAGWPPDKDVEGVFHRPKTKFLDEFIGFNTGDVTWSGMQRLRSDAR